MDDMRALRVGVLSDDIYDISDDISHDVSDGISDSNAEGASGAAEESRPGAGSVERRQTVILSPDCYVPLVEAYAQSSMWERAIEAYQEGFATGRGHVEAVDYRVSALEEGRSTGVRVSNDFLHETLFLLLSRCAGFFFIKM